jgi:hypothetical protein
MDYDVCSLCMRDIQNSLNTHPFARAITTRAASWTAVVLCRSGTCGNGDGNSGAPHAGLTQRRTNATPPLRPNGLNRKRIQWRPQARSAGL